MAIFLQEEPRLECPPRIRKVKTGANITDAEFGVELADNYLLRLYDWQRDVVSSWLSRDEEGLYAHKTCGLILPRQNGKSKGVIGARMLIGAVFYGEKIRYSAHRVDTMREMWDIFVNVFGDTRYKFWEYPELHALVKRMSHINGHLYIALKNGGTLNFVARSTGSGRGNTVDVNIYDEAQYLTETMLSSALPSQSASPSGNPQVIYVGTPPDLMECTGEVLGRVRENVLKREPEGIAWHEWSVEEIGDVADRSRWYAANPSLGLSLLESAVVNEFNNMTPETFARERLGYWASIATLKAVDDDLWGKTTVSDFNEDYTKYCVGIKFAPNGSQFSVAVGLLLDDETTYCELVMNETQSRSLVELIDWLVKRKNKISLIAIDGKSGAGELYERLVKSGMSKKAVKILSSKEVVVAATMLNSSLTEGTIKHLEGKVLDASAREATKRKIGVDGYGFGGDSIPLEALSFANWAARTTRRNPEPRKMRLL